MMFYYHRLPPLELQDFELNNAHTFGPNEEFQLRSIINEFDPGGGVTQQSQLLNLTLFNLTQHNLI